MIGILDRLRSTETKENDESGEENPSLLVLFAAELLGTAMLVFLGCMGCLTTMPETEILSPWPSLGFGLTVMTVIQVVGHISGAYINPQVTLGAVIMGKLKLVLLPLYICAQIVGGIIGYGLLWLLTPSDVHGDMCVTRVSGRINVFQGLVVEIVLTAILVMISGSVWDRRNSKNTDSTAIRFGLFVAVTSMCATPFTGASMNSARSLAPAIFANSWSNHWVYWVGPTLGAVIGSVFYRVVFYGLKPMS